MSESHVALKDVLSSELISIAPEDTLRAALVLMTEHRISALPVLDDQKHCVGVISVTDFLGITRDLSDELTALSRVSKLDHDALLERFENANLLRERVQDWMSLDPVSVGVNSSVATAAQIMLRNRVHRLIVVDNEQLLLGVVSAMDLLAAFVEESKN